MKQKVSRGAMSGNMFLKKKQEDYGYKSCINDGQVKVERLQPQNYIFVMGCGHGDLTTAKELRNDKFS
jgi:hypothetical protein